MKISKDAVEERVKDLCVTITDDVDKLCALFDEIYAIVEKAHKAEGVEIVDDAEEEAMLDRTYANRVRLAAELHALHDGRGVDDLVATDESRSYGPRDF